MTAGWYVRKTREIVYSMLRGDTPPWHGGAAILLLPETVRSESDD